MNSLVGMSTIVSSSTRTVVSICDSGRDCRVWHIPQGKRKPCRVVFHRERYVCKGCGRSFMEQIPWIHENSHMTAALYDCIKKDLHSYTTLKEIARVNCISVYFVSLVLKSLRLPVPPLCQRSSAWMRLILRSRNTDRTGKILPG